MTTLRIYADFNGIVNGPKNPAREAVVIDTFGSLRDLANAGVVLRAGLPLIVRDESDETEDLEAHGTAEFDAAHKWWVVEFDEEGIRYVPAGNRSYSTEFRCVSCQHPLHELIANKGLKVGDVCPACGTPIHEPILPPDQQRKREYFVAMKA